MADVIDHVIIRGNVSYDRVEHIVREALPVQGARFSSDCYVLFYRPNDDILIMEERWTAGEYDVESIRQHKLIPAECPGWANDWLFEVAQLAAAEGFRSWVCYVQNVAEDYCAIRFFDSIFGVWAKEDVSYVLRDGRFHEEDAGNGLKACVELLRDAVSQPFDDPIDYLVWFDDWYWGTFESSWRSSATPRPLMIVQSGRRLEKPISVNDDLAERIYFGAL